MDRQQEHYDLKQELTETPSALDNILIKAQSRATKHAIRKRILMPLSSCAAVFILFVGLVNFSAVVASAVENIPVLQTLARFVTFSPSLSDAIEHGHVQSPGFEQLVGEDVTARVEHIVVDGQFLHIFCAIESSDDIEIGVGFTITISQDDLDEPSLLLVNPPDTENENVYYVIIGFDDLLPDTVEFKGELRDISSGDAFRASPLIGSFSFTIEIDEVFAIQEIIEVNHSFEIEGQHMTLTSVMLSPIHTRVSVETDWAHNSEQLQRLEFYMINENGERFDPPSLDSIIPINLPSGGANDSPTIPGQHGHGPQRFETFFLRSAFFSESESLTIYITGVEWIGMEWFGPDSVLLDEPIEIRVR